MRSIRANLSRPKPSARPAPLLSCKHTICLAWRCIAEIKSATARLQQGPHVSGGVSMKVPTRSTSEMCGGKARSTSITVIAFLLSLSTCQRRRLCADSTLPRRSPTCGEMVNGRRRGSGG